MHYFTRYFQTPPCGGFRSRPWLSPWCLRRQCHDHPDRAGWPQKLGGLTDWDIFFHENMGFYMVLSCFIMNLYGFSSWFDHVVLLHDFIYETWGSQHLNKGSKKVLFSTDMHAMGIWAVDLPGLAEAIWLFSFPGHTAYGVQNKRVPAACYWKGVFFPLRI